MRADLAIPVGRELQNVLADAKHGRQRLLGLARVLIERLPRRRNGLRRGLRSGRFDRRNLRILVLRLLRDVLGDDPIGIVDLLRLILWKLGFLGLGLLLGKRLLLLHRFAIRSRRKVGVRRLRRGHLDGELRAGRAEAVVAVIGPQVRQRERGAAQMERKRRHRCQNPKRPGWSGLVRHRGPLRLSGACRRRPRSTFQRNQLHPRIAA